MVIPGNIVYIRMWSIGLRSEVCLGNNYLCIDSIALEWRFEC